MRRLRTVRAPTPVSYCAGHCQLSFPLAKGCLVRVCAGAEPNGRLSQARAKLPGDWCRLRVRLPLNPADKLHVGGCTSFSRGEAGAGLFFDRLRLSRAQHLYGMPRGKLWMVCCRFFGEALMQAQKQRRQRTLRRLRWCGIPFFPSECNAQSGFLLQLVRSLRSLRDPARQQTNATASGSTSPAPLPRWTYAQKIKSFIMHRC